MITGGSIIANVSGGVLTDYAPVPPEMFRETPAGILGIFIIGKGLMSSPILDDSWPLYVGYMPSDPKVKPNIGAIYDTPSFLDGRLMIGKVIEHYGVQIRIRAEDYETGWAKIIEISEELDKIYNEEVERNGDKFLLQNVSRKTGANYIGMEAGVQRQFDFTVNYGITMKVLE